MYGSASGKLVNPGLHEQRDGQYLCFLAVACTAVQVTPVSIAVVSTQGQLSKQQCLLVPTYPAHQDLQLNKQGATLQALDSVQANACACSDL